MTCLTLGGGVLGIAALYYGADYLVRGGVALARRFRVPALVIGLTLVAFGTSAPELVVSICASLQGSGDISIGNVVGSNICNLGLILGLCAIISPMAFAPGLLKLDVPAMVLVSLLLAWMVWIGHGVGRFGALIFLLCFAIYLGIQLCRARRGEDVVDGEAKDALAEAGEHPLALILLWIAGGLTALVVGAHLFVNAAIWIARTAGVSEAVIGLTVVAVGTSLPELATSLVAAIRKEQDIALGNLVGSNLFNIICILGIAPLVSPLEARGITAADLCVMSGIACFVWGAMLLNRTRIGRGSGIVLFAAYCGYVFYLVQNAG